MRRSLEKKLLRRSSLRTNGGEPKTCARRTLLYCYFQVNISVAGVATFNGSLERSIHGLGSRLRARCCDLDSKSMTHVAWPTPFSVNAFEIRMGRHFLGDSCRPLSPRPFIIVAILLQSHSPRVASDSASGRRFGSSPPPVLQHLACSRGHCLGDLDVRTIILPKQTT